MAEVAVDERRLLKTIRWWDGFVIGLANPGFLLIGLWGSIIALGGQVGDRPLDHLGHHRRAPGVHLLRARGDVPGQAGRPVGLRAGGMAQALLLRRPDRGLRLLVRVVERARDLRKPDRVPAARRVRRRRLPRDRRPTTRRSFEPLGWAQLIGVMCIVLCWIFNIRGMRPAVGLSYVVGALMIFPILVIAIGGFVTGDFSNHEINSNFLAANVEFYGDSPTFFNQFVMIMVWLYILGWSTYGPEAGATFAPEYKDTANDTRKALASVGALNVVLSHPAPDRRPRDDRLRRPLRRPDRRRLADRRRQLDRRRRASGSSWWSVSAPACCSR